MERSPIQVLIVEDNPGDAFLVQELLDEVAADEFSTSQVTRFSEAAEFLASKPCDAVLLDLSLPDVQGLETVRRMRQLQPKLGIVVMSGLSDRQVALEALQIGAQDYLVKGRVDGEQLVRVLRYSVERSRLLLELEASRARAEALAALGDALQSSSSPEQMIEAAMARIGPTLCATQMSYLRRQGDEFLLLRSWGETTERPVLPAQRLLEGAWYLDHLKAQADDQRFSGMAIGVEPVKLLDGQIVGVLEATRDQSQGPWREGERDLMRRAAATLGLGLERAQAAKRLNEVRFQRVLEADLLGVYFWRNNGDIFESNRKFLDMLGYSREELLAGKLNRRDLVPSEFRQLSDQVLQQMRETGEMQPIEKEYFRKDGSRLPVLVGGATLDDEGIDGVAFVLDISERRATMRALEQSEQRFRSLVFATSQIYWYTDPNGQFTTEQPGWAAFTGDDFATYGGTGWITAVHPDHREAILQIWNQSVRTHSRYEVQYPLRRHDGEYRDMDVRATPVLEADSSVREWVGVNIDITERKRAERALIESEAELRRLSDTQRRFVADASHELRAPLTSIQGNLELLRRYPQMNQEDKDASLRDAEREAGRLGRLVNDLLLLARGDAGANLSFSEVDLSGLLTEVWRDAQRMASQTMLPPDLVPARVEGHRDRLKQLLTILLDNARKYTPPDGIIGLSLAQSGDSFEIRVTDNGPGLSAEDLSHVFERFYRVDRSRMRGPDPGGSGLGLPIAEWIVAQHHGSIRLESELGRGTSAIVCLPARNSQD